ncbi:MAG: NAD(P)H-dependent glycerol-3-phosphate dehydrogenase [Alicyclobacillus sp.]|nr:NAD(P)H-dependent glycerol-3-phosphate dehydrogenase [Alicyclobacillus sp.]
MNATVLGAGSWGTALACVLADNGHNVTLWGRSSAVTDEINQHHRNSRYFPGIDLPSAIRASSDLTSCVRQADLIVFAVASTAMVEVVRAVSDAVPSRALLAHAVKGFDIPRLRRMSEVLAEEIPGSADRISCITGPSHAEEVVDRLPTTVVVASSIRQVAEAVQDAFMTPYLRVYTNPDVLGAELGGTLKNIIALGVGIADGLGLGDNAKAALITRGLAEISRLGVKMGALPRTFAGLSGLGDLIVTCTSRHSRNFRTGQLLGQGMSLDAALAQVNMVVEGVPATQAALTLAARYGVEMPITEALANVLFHGARPADAVEGLMGRARNHEMEEVARPDQPPAWTV